MQKLPSPFPGHTNHQRTGLPGHSWLAERSGNRRQDAPNKQQAWSQGTWLFFLLLPWLCSVTLGKSFPLSLFPYF